MNVGKLNRIGYGGEGFGTPLSADALDDVLALARLPPGARVLDLGCGCGQVAAHLAGRGMHVTAVERLTEPAEAARWLTTDVGPGAVQVIVGEASALDLAAPFDLVMALGAGRIAGANAGPAATLQALAARATPGGAVLWGETFWARPPGPVLKLVADAAGVFAGHDDYVRAGADTGLTLLTTRASTLAEWDDYVARYVGALEAYARDHAEDPDAGPMRDRGHAWRDLYETEARETMGFGLYLFRAPD